MKYLLGFCGRFLVLDHALYDLSRGCSPQKIYVNYVTP